MLNGTPETALEIIEGIRRAERLERTAAVRRFTALADYADACSFSDQPDGSDLFQLGHEGTPAVREFAELELGAAMGIDSELAAVDIGLALDVRHRLPHAWEALNALRLHVWQARKLAMATGDLSLQAAKAVDAQLSPGYGHWSWRRLESACTGLVLQALPPAEALARQRAAAERRRVTFMEPGQGVQDVWATLDATDGRCLESQVGRLAHVLLEGGSTQSLDARRAQALGLLANPARALQLLQQSVLDQVTPLAECPLEGEPGHTCGQVTVDPALLRPQAELVVHIHEDSLSRPAGVGRSPRLGALTVETIRRVLAGCAVSVRPVLRVDSLAPADAYEVPAAMREAVLHRNPTSVFPFSRKRRGLDLDHTVPYAAGVPEQTRTDNLGPLSRREHRAKTHAGWRVTQPLRGVFLWRSPFGFVYAVTQSGTYELHAPVGTTKDLALAA